MSERWARALKACGAVPMAEHRGTWWWIPGTSVELRSEADYAALALTTLAERDGGTGDPAVVYSKTLREWYCYTQSTGRVYADTWTEAVLDAAEEALTHDA